MDLKEGGGEEKLEGLEGGETCQDAFYERENYIQCKNHQCSKVYIYLVL